MITREKLNVYKYFNGDADGWARTGSQSQKEIMKDGDWLLIESFIQDIFLLNKGLSSKAFNDELNEKLNTHCDTNETIQELKKLSSVSN